MDFPRRLPVQAQQKGPTSSKGKAPADSSKHEATLPSHNEDDLPTTLEGKKQFIAKAQADAIMAKQFEREIQEQETGAGRRRPANIEIPKIGELPSEYNAGTSTSPVRKSPGGRRGGDFGPPPPSPSRTVGVSSTVLFSILTSTRDHSATRTSHRASV